MSWKRLDILSTNRFAQRGLSSTVAAGLVCKEVESFMPDMCIPVSVKNGVLHIKVSPHQAMPFKLRQGELLVHLERVCKEKNLPHISSVRLTIEE